MLQCSVCILSTCPRCRCPNTTNLSGARWCSVTVAGCQCTQAALARRLAYVCPPPASPRGVAELTHTRLRIPAAAARVSAVRVRVVPPLQHPRRCRLWAGNSDQHLDIYTGYLQIDIDTGYLHWISTLNIYNYILTLVNYIKISTLDI